MKQPDRSLLIDEMETALAWCDQSYGFQACNAAARTFLGLSGLRQCPEELRSVVSRVLMSGETVSGHDLTLTLGAGYHVGPLDYTAKGHAFGGQSGVLLEMVNVDRARKIIQEKERLDQQKAVRTLLRGLAHELRNPLAGVRGVIQLLARDDASVNLNYELALSEIDRLDRLIEKLLLRTNASRHRPFNVHECIERVISLSKAESHNAININRDYDPSLPLINGDRDQIIQILANLVSNARQAVANGGDVAVRTRVRRQYTLAGQRHRLVAVIEVEDNGPGVPETMRDSLFLPLVSGRSNGMGLGLAVAQELAQQHGGVLDYQSVQGLTTFSLLLPLAEP